MARVFPTTRQLVLSTIVALASHPRIQNPNIFYLKSKKETKISSWRSFGGYELQDEGLVCSVYPAYSSKTAKGSPPPLGRQTSIVYKPYTLGSRTDASSSDEATYTLVVELAYRDPNFSEIMTLGYDQLLTIDGGPLLTPHGTTVMVHEGGSLNLATDDIESGQPSLEGTQRTYQTLDIKVNPAEELLREYAELIRLALNDIRGIVPFRFTSQVKSIDFPTTSWTRESEDVLFHIAFVVWELTLYAPNAWKDIYFMPVNSITTETGAEKQVLDLGLGPTFSIP